MLKKILFLAIAIFSFSSLYAAETGTQISKKTISQTEMICADNDTLTVFVQASNTVDELCSYFEDSWVDIGLSIYCNTPAGAATPTTCTVFKVVKYICVSNDIIQLTIEGDFNGAAKQVVKQTGEEILYRLIGSSSGYVLKPVGTMGR